MRLFLLLVVCFLFPTVFWGQRTRMPIEQSTAIEQALAAFRLGNIEEACPAVDQIWVKQPNLAFQNQDLQIQELRYANIACRLLQANKGAVNEATQFIQETTVIAWKDRTHYLLGNYYFNQQDWAAAIQAYKAAAIANLTNTEIAILQFNCGYSHFVLKQMELAKPLLNSIRQLPGTKFQVPATYYYGLILYGEGKLNEALNCFQPLEQDPTFGKLAVYYSCQILLSKGQSEQVISFLANRTTFLQDTGYPSLELKKVLGQAYFATNNYKNALPLLETYVATADSFSRSDLYALSYSQFRLGKWTEAINGFKKLTNKQDTLAVYALFHIGESYVQLNNKQEARSAYSLCKQNEIDRSLQSRAQFSFSKLSYELGYFDEAVRELDNFIRLHADDPAIGEANEILFASLAASSNYKRALQVLEPIQVPSAQTLRLIPAVRFGRAVELFQDGDLVGAKNLLQKNINDKAAAIQLPFTHFWLGEIAYRQQDFTAAVQHYATYLSLGAGVVGEASPIHAHYNMGYAYLGLSQYKLALGQFEKVSYGPRVGNTSLELDARLRIADCQLMLRQYKVARQCYQAFVDIEAPSAPYAFFQIASIVGIENVNEKIRLLKELMIRYSTSEYVSSAKKSLAEALMEGEKFREAVPVLEDLLANSGVTDQPVLLFNMAVVYYNLDENEKSLSFYQRLIEQYPGSDEAADAVQELKAVYVELGRATEYGSYLKKQGISVSVNLEDSLQYLAADQLVEAKNYPKAILALQQYTVQFPQGKYHADALFQLANCYYARKEIEQTLVSLEQLLAGPPNRYQVEAEFMAARICYFDLKKYDKAASHYEQLVGLTSKAEDRLEIFRGLLRTNYQLKNWALATQYGDSLNGLKEKSKDDQALSALVKAKNYFANNKEVEGQQILQSVLQLNKASLAAEARFEMAHSMFRLQQWKVAEKAAFETINKSGSYEWWVTKSYLLLGDIYQAQKDFFNARATYQSVFENATDPSLRKEAQDKLDFLKQNEKGNQ